MGEEVGLSDVEVQNGGSPKEEPKCGYSSRKYSLGLKDVNWCLLQKFVAEFLGTLFLILFCVGSANHRTLAGMGTATPAYFLSISIAFGFGIGGIVHILADSSGGHVNPAVTLALFLDKRVSLIVALVYIIAQFAGGFVGAGLLYGLGNYEKLENIAGVNGYNTAMINTGQAFFLEVFGTMFLILTILATISEKRGHHASYLQPFAIGVAILVMHIFLIPYTNCAINPVRGTVWNVVTGQVDTHTLVFLFAPLVGAILAVPTHNIFFTH